MTRDWNKAFCIGLQRTGTSSFARFLASTGLKVHGFNKYGIVEYVRYGKIDTYSEFIDQHDAAEDAPAFLAFKELDKNYPNSKFILTTRETPYKFVKSKAMQILRASPEERWNTMINNIHLYGRAIPLFNQDYFKKYYSIHNNNIRDYFEDREDDLIEICVDTNDEPWKDVANFLDIKYNPEKQDIENKDKSDYSSFEELVEKAYNYPLTFFWDYPVNNCPHNLKWRYYE